MTNTKHPGAGPPAAHAKRLLARTPVALGLWGLLLTAATPFAHADDAQHTGWWADAGLGGGALSTPSDGVVDGGGGVWIELLLGRRLNDHWLMGLGLGGLGLHPTASNADSYSGNGSIYGESLTHTMLAVRYVPQVDHGWVWGLGAGAAFYWNKSVEVLTGNYDSGNGWAADAAVGYDWKIGQNKAHVETVLNVEQGRISYNAPLTGQFSYSQVAASVHIAWF
jgi:Outer membrane protein beta-barrel domain